MPKDRSRFELSTDNLRFARLVRQAKGKEAPMSLWLQAAVIISALASSLFSQSKAADAYPKGELLVEPAELATRLESFTVLDARPREAYNAGHVPGAVWVPHAEWEKAFYAEEGRDRQAWQERITSLEAVSKLVE